MTNRDNQFFEKIKESLEQHEVAYNSSDWSDLEKRLDQAAIAPIAEKSGSYLYSLLAGGVLLAGAAFYMVNDHLSSEAPTNQEIAAAKTEAELNNVTTAVGFMTVAPSDHSQEEVTTAANTAVQEGQTISEQSTPQGESTSQSKSAMAATIAAVNAQESTTNENEPLNTPPAITAPANSDKGEAKLEKVDAAFNSPKTACVGELVNFELNQVTDKANYAWNFDDGAILNGALAVHSFDSEGTYKVSVDANKAQKRADRFTQEITVYPKPGAAFTWENSNQQQYDPSLVFNAKDNNANTQLIWNFGDGISSTKESPKHLYRYKGQYKVQLIAVNELGCADTSYQQVRVSKDYNLLAPQAFTPNGDSKNDTWLPYALKRSNVEFDLQIIDKSSGNVIFSSNSNDQEWDGKVNGRSVRAGEAFVWQVKVKEENVMRDYGGTVTILK